MSSSYSGMFNHLPTVSAHLKIFKGSFLRVKLAERDTTTRELVVFPVLYLLPSDFDFVSFLSCSCFLLSRGSNNNIETIITFTLCPTAIRTKMVLAVPGKLWKCFFFFRDLRGYLVLFILLPIACKTVKKRA